MLDKIIESHDALIFDFDGVIVDSLAIKAEAFGQLFIDLGPQVMAKVKEHHLNNGGVSRYEKFKYYYREFLGKEITPQESANLDERYSKLVVEQVIKAKEIPGVTDLLKKIKAAHKPAWVISATPQAEIRHIVKERQMGNYFKGVFGSPASKKDNLGALIKNNSLVPGKCVFFGDAKSDYEAASFYHVDFIGVVVDEGSELSQIAGITKIRNFR